MPSTGHPSNGLPFGMVDTAVIRDRSLPPNVRTVYTYLATYCGKTRSAWPSRATIAADTGLSLRAVTYAVKAGAEAGLWDIQHRLDETTGRQTSNVYRLRDFGRGYESRGAPDAPGPVQDVHGDGAPGAHEQDHRPRPSSTQKTSSDAACGPLAAGEARPSQAPNAIDTDPRAIRLDLPAEFDFLSDGRVVQRLMRSSFGALRRIGLDLDDYGRDKLKRSLVVTLDKTGDARETADMLRRTLELARDGHPDWASMVVPLQAKAS